MILQEDIIKVGRLMKPHGIKGEITILFDKEQYADIEVEYYILEIDGIYVPFFLDSFRVATSTTAKIKFENVDDENDASFLSNLSVFIPREKNYFEELEPDSSWSRFIGFYIVDQEAGDLGEIVDIDETTINTLFVVQDDEESYLIPATEDFIVEINEDDMRIVMSLPPGLISL